MDSSDRLSHQKATYFQILEFKPLRGPLVYMPRIRLPDTKWTAIELEDDESYWREMLEKSPSEFFLDHVIWPLLGAALVALLILMIVGSAWLSTKLLLGIGMLLN